MRPGALLVAAAIVVVTMCGSCKRRAPTKATHVWLDARHGCASLSTGPLACWGTYSAPDGSPRSARVPEVVASDGLTRGTEASQPFPASIAASEVTSAAYGEAHACVSLRDGSVLCWGKNADGELGDGTRSASDQPVPVHGLGNVADVHAGAHHTCARLVNKTASCWGRNDHHQLANGTTESSSQPVPLFGLVGVEQLALGGDSGCVRLGDGDVRCWGGNAQGQLGDGATTDHDVPASIRFVR